MGKVNPKKPVNFAGSPDVYSTNGYYTFNGKDSCGVDKETLQQVCKYTLHPMGPGVDMSEPNGVKKGIVAPDYTKCAVAQ